MFSVKYNEFVKAYLVVNTTTGLAHSSWDTRLDALIAARDLNNIMKKKGK